MLIYLAERLYQSITDLFRHWYVDGFHFFMSRAFDVLRFLDRIFSVKVNITHMFHPLYQDRSLVGYVLGFTMRFLKVVTGGVVYLALIVLFGALYLAWAVMPFYILLKIIGIDAKNIF